MGKNKKADIEYPFENGEVIHWTNLNSITTKIQPSFLTQLPGGKETAQGF